MLIVIFHISFFQYANNKAHFLVYNKGYYNYHDTMDYGYDYDDSGDDNGYGNGYGNDYGNGYGNDYGNGYDSDDTGEFNNMYWFSFGCLYNYKFPIFHFHYN